MESSKMKLVVVLLFVFYFVDFCQSQDVHGHLRVATYSNPLANLPNGTINKFGTIENKLLQWLSEDMNFTYDICVPPDVLQIGTPDETRGKGTWTGILGLLVRDEADVSIAFGPELFSRYMAVDITTTIILDTIAIMLPYPKKNNDAAALFYAFDNVTWFLTALTIVSVIIALWVIAQVQNKGERSAGMITVFILGVFFSQGGFLRSFSLPARFVHGSFLIAVLVLNYAYGGVLVSMITAPTLQFTVKSIEDVAANKEIRPLIINESNTQTEFEESSLPVFQEVIQRIKRDESKLLVPSSGDLLEILLSDPRHVLIMSNLLADSEIEKDFRETGSCRATILPKPVNDRTNSLYLKKGSPYTKSFNIKLMQLRQAGLSDYLDSTYDTFAARCYMDTGPLKNKNRGRRQGPLTLYELRGVFLVFAYAILLCFAAFLCELFYDVYERYCAATNEF